MRKWAITLLIGLLLIGLGAGMTVFEFSNFTIKDYSSTLAENNVNTSYIQLNPNLPLSIENYNQDIEVIVDDALGDQARIEVAEPYFAHFTNDNSTTKNNLEFWVEVDPFSIMKTSLDGLRQNIVYNFYDDATAKIYVNSTYAKTYTKQTSPNQHEQIQILSENYETQINQLHEDYQNQLNQQTENYENQMKALQEEIDNLRS